MNQSAPWGEESTTALGPEVSQDRPVGPFQILCIYISTWIYTYISILSATISFIDFQIFGGVLQPPASRGLNIGGTKHCQTNWMIVYFFALLKSDGYQLRHLVLDAGHEPQAAAVASSSTSAAACKAEQEVEEQEEQQDTDGEPEMWRRPDTRLACSERFVLFTYRNRKKRRPRRLWHIEWRKILYRLRDFENQEAEEGFSAGLWQDEVVAVCSEEQMSGKISPYHWAGNVDEICNCTFTWQHSHAPWCGCSRIRKSSIPYQISVGKPPETFLQIFFRHIRETCVDKRPHGV